MTLTLKAVKMNLNASVKQLTLLLAYAILDFMIKKIIATPQLEFMYLITDFESFIEFA